MSKKDEPIRLLNPEEIECRIGTISEKGLSLLLYKDARADMKILDEHFGPMDWQRKHELIGGNLYCTVSVWDDEKNQWISKSDVGTESNTEKEKGQASDSFKRACVSLGIGRELYTAPFIWIPAAKVKLEQRNGKLTTYDKFKVTHIAYNDNREICELTILNQNNVCVYSLIARQMDTAGLNSRKSGGNHVNNNSDDNSVANNINTSSPDAKNTNDADITARKEAVNRELKRTGVALDTVLKRYGVNSLEEMSDVTYQKAMISLKKTESRVA